MISLATATPAQALCFGKGESDNGYFIFGLEKSAWASTCNDKGDYTGRAYDTQQDGYCFEVQWHYGGKWRTQGVSCDSAGAQYTYNGADTVVRGKAGGTVTTSYTVWGF